MPLIGDESEQHFMGRIRRHAKLLGWEDFHQQDSMGTRAGLPDLILVRPPRVIFAELKSEHGRLTPAQRHTLANLMACPGVETYIWRPHDARDIWRLLARRDRIDGMDRITPGAGCASEDHSSGGVAESAGA
jgi:hypothetical protein